VKRIQNGHRAGQSLAAIARDLGQTAFPQHTAARDGGRRPCVRYFSDMRRVQGA
jgi:hypothetical protein